VSGELHALTPLTLDTHWTGGWVGPRVSLDTVAKSKNLFPVGNQTLVIQPTV